MSKNKGQLRSTTHASNTVRDFELGYDPQSINFQEKTGGINMGALKTQMDRRVIKILRMLGQSCNQQQTKQGNQPFQTITNEQSIDKYQSQKHCQEQSFSHSQKFMEPQDLISDTDSNESITKKTIEQMSIYKIFGFKSDNHNSRFREENDSDYLFMDEKNIGTSTKSNYMLPNLNIGKNLQNVTNKHWKKCSQTQRQNNTRLLDLNEGSQNKKSRKREHFTANKQNSTGSKRKFLLGEASDSKMKVSVKQFLENHGHDTSQKQSLKHSPARKQSVNHSVTKVGRSSAKRHTILSSTIKKQQSIYNIKASKYTIEQMQGYLQQYIKNKNTRKQPTINNIRISTLKRIENKCSQSLKPFGCV